MRRAENPQPSGGRGERAGYACGSALGEDSLLSTCPVALRDGGEALVGKDAFLCCLPAVEWLRSGALD
ncbi:hypothetical protein NDU88_000693 [Pleurodeles waltl]|uniref:Uncharacterized protein n=1 Tax=Pleurodeles waltl TaxID=8319 RepID=A0AAV7KRG1_PLEWA|nr:hypothetical protein NDU88_000693 [Pleurodeles waltl]